MERPGFLPGARKMVCNAQILNLVQAKISIWHTSTNILACIWVCTKRDYIRNFGYKTRPGSYANISNKARAMFSEK